MEYVLIIGAGKSGKSVCEQIARDGALPVLFDDEYIQSDLQKRFVKDANYIVISPGVNPNSEIVSLAEKYGVRVIGEIEFAYLHSSGNYKNLIGVTGTNGKTTVVSMIGSMLVGDAVVAGNIGTPWSVVINECHENCILELSSFQLLSTDKFKANIACILNLAPDHIDYHGSEEEYYNAKLRILRNQTQKDVCVLNYDDDRLRGLTGIKSKALYFGFNNPRNGCFVMDGAIYYRHNNQQMFIADIGFVENPLKHNIQNVMATVCVCGKVSENIYSVLYRILDYKYKPFRMSFCGNIQGLQVYNDSKSTNVASTISALNSLESLKNIALVLGGRYKKESFEKVFKFSNIKSVYVFGESKEVIASDAGNSGFSNIYICETLDEIVEKIFSHSDEYDGLLFSPGCASFDMYSGYEERGNHFAKLLKRFCD